jgi:hypothetical protein
LPFSLSYKSVYTRDQYYFIACIHSSTYEWYNTIQIISNYTCSFEIIVFEHFLTPTLFMNRVSNFQMNASFVINDAISFIVWTCKSSRRRMLSVNLVHKNLNFCFLQLAIWKDMLEIWKKIKYVCKILICNFCSNFFYYYKFVHGWESSIWFSAK